MLRHSGQSWSQAYQQFLLTCPEYIVQCIDNMQILHECKDSRDALFAKRRNRRRVGLSLELQHGSRGSTDEFGEDTDELLLEHLSSLESCRSQHSERSNADVLAALECAEECGMVSGRIAFKNPHDHVGSHVPVTDLYPEKEIIWHKTYEARKEQSGKSALLVPVQSASTCLLSKQTVKVVSQMARHSEASHSAGNCNQGR
jgi:hypothetical protein